MPSTPGWESGRPPELTDWATAARGRPVMCEYRSEGGWLWSAGAARARWSSCRCWRRCRSVSTSWHSVPGGLVSSACRREDALISQLRGCAALGVPAHGDFRAHVLHAAAAHYRSVYFCARAIQGRINDVCLLLAVGATRGRWKVPPPPIGRRALVEACAVNTIMSHVLLGDDADDVGCNCDGWPRRRHGPRFERPARPGRPELLSPQGARSSSPPSGSPRTADGCEDGPAAVPVLGVLLEWVSCLALEGVDHAL